MNTDTRTAVNNAIELLTFYNTADGFDHKAFLNEMDSRSVAIHGRKLTRKEQRTLAKMVGAYLARQSVQA